MKKLTDVEKWQDIVETDVNQGAAIFGDLASEEAFRIANAMGVAYIRDVVEKLRTDAGAGLLRNLPVDFRLSVISGLSGEKKDQLSEILSYKDGTAGALMAKEYLSIPIDNTIAQTVQYLRDMSKDKKGKVSYIYVVDKNDRLEGVIQVRDLVFYGPEMRISEILRRPVVQVETGMSQLDVAKLLERHRYLGLPVVSVAQKLVGVISADNAMRVFEKEAVDDIAKIIGTSAEEIQTHSVSRILRLRLPWLFVNIVSGLLCAFILGFFEESIQTVAMLFLFVPVVLGLSESTGVQGATIVVRNMALGEVSFLRLSSLFVREALAGVFIGTICGIVVGLVAYLWKADPHVGTALACSLTITVIISAIIGLILPLLFKKFKIDPAMASGPLVLAICDIQTLVVYFCLSSAMLKG
jgi:magnesium transporter